MGLRDATKASIFHALEKNGYYKRADFTIEDSAKVEGTKVRIIFKYRKDFWLSAEIPSQKSEIERKDSHWTSGIPSLVPTIRSAFVIKVQYSPGEVVSEETAEIFGLDQFIDAIGAWTERMKRESAARPQMRMLEAQQRQIDELTAQIADISDELFSQEEAKEVLARLAALEKQLTESMQQHIQDKDELTARIKALNSDVAMLKDNVKEFTKRSLAAALMTRALNWLQVPGNQKLLKSGTDLVTAMLGSGQPHDVHNLPPADFN